MKNMFPKATRICMMISAAIMVVALVMSLFGLGINFGIDFTGGATIAYEINSAYEDSDIAAMLDKMGVSQYQIQKTGATQTGLMLRVGSEIGETDTQDFQKELETLLLEKYPDIDVKDSELRYVGPVAGQVLLTNAIMSVLLAALLMLIYIAVRFDFNSGLAAVIGLLHDVLIMLSFMVLLRSVIQMNSSFIAAMLTIVGYSINNTIVIFDRIRENNKRGQLAHLGREEIAKISVKESLGRTINTTLTTLITIVSLYVLGVDAIKEFSLPIIIGIVAGVYSANMINGYVWAALENSRKKRGKKQNKAKAAPKAQRGPVV